MSSNDDPGGRRVRVRAFTLSTLAFGLLATGCYTSSDPVAVDEPIEPSTSIIPSGPAIPVPTELQGCGSAEPYDTGDPAHPFALYQICWPAQWNGSFIVYAHGYTSVFEELAIPAEADGEADPGGPGDLALFATQLGFGFATTSYRVNGLAIKEGTDDIVDLQGIVRAEASERFGVGSVPVLVTGASEGGAVATLAAERYPNLFQGSLATCGPTGNFQKQINYLGDFNVLFNYYFPEVFSNGSGGFLVTPAQVAIDPVLHWGDPAQGAFGPYAQAAAGALAADPGAALELLRVLGVPIDPNDPQNSAVNAIFGLLWYNVYATEDAKDKLGGRPFDNRWRWYRGSSNDWRLNRGVQRFSAEPTAKQAIASHYQTSGQLDMPYVSLHTTGDEIVQFAQQPIYRFKALVNGSAREHSALPVLRYGHCNFEEGDLTAGLGLLLLKVGFSSPSLVADAMASEQARATFWELGGR